MRTLVTVILIFCQTCFVLTKDVANCANDIVENCKLDEYFVSTLEIVDREMTRDRAKAETYFERQVCKNALDELAKFRRCVVRKAGRHCWTWTGVFDSIRALRGDIQDDMFRMAKRYEQVFVIVEYNLCTNQKMKTDYMEIRSCSHKRFNSDGGTSFHEQYMNCLNDPKYPNPIKDAMDKMDLCRDTNRDYACMVNAMLGDQCNKVKGALLRYANMHAGHGGVHHNELGQLNFILQVAHSDHLRLPNPNECDTLMTRPSRPWVPYYMYYYITRIGFVVMIGLTLYFRDTLVMLGERYILRS